jgi:hypothetical protein
MKFESESGSINSPHTPRRRIARSLIGGGLIGMTLLAWCVVKEVKIWTGPVYGLRIQTQRNRFLCFYYRTDLQSMECSAYRFDPPYDSAERLFIVSIGQENYFVLD